jgi:multidrug efflux pump subunit AcrB
MSQPQTPEVTDDPTRKGVIAWMVRNPVTANLMMLFIVLGGIRGGMSIKQEIFPSFDLDLVSVVVPYPGASPAEVEQGIVLAVEEAIRGVEGVKKVTSSSNEGVGSVLAEIELSADPDQVTADIKGEVDRIRTFPADAEDPTVNVVSRKSRVISLVIAGPATPATLHSVAEKARMDLLAAGGLTQVEVEGLPPLELSVAVDRDTLKAYGLSLDDVARQISAASLELPGGALETQGGEVLVRVSDRRRDAAALAEIVLRGTRDNARVRLGDIATIADGFEDNDQSTWFNGQPAVLLTAYRVGNEGAIDVADAVKAFEEVLAPTLPAGLTVTTWEDESELLKGRIELLTDDALSGAILVFLTLVLFLDLRLAFWVGVGIPTAFFGAFFLMPILGVSVNMISLFALILMLGIVVDDAIVIGENTFDNIQKGMDPMSAAIAGTQEVSVPVFFAAAATLAAFAPLLFIPGVIGKIFSIIPLVVIAVLILSILDGFFILPAHLGHTSEPHGLWKRALDIIHVPRDHITVWLDRWIQQSYAPMLEKMLIYRYATLAAAAALTLAALGVVVSGLLPFSFLPKVEADTLRVTARMPYGVPVEQTEGVRRSLESALAEAITGLGEPDDVRGVLSFVGQGAAARGPTATSRPVGSHLLSIEVDLVGMEERPFLTSELDAAWREHLPPLPGVQALSFAFSTGPSGGAAIDVQLSHTDTRVLAEASEALTQTMRGYDDLVNIDNTYAAGKPQLDFALREEGRALGLTSLEVGRQLRAAFYGAEAVREQRDRNEIKVMVRSPKEQRVSEHDLDQLMIRTPTGAWVPLRQVADFERGRAATTITRESGRRVVDVKAELAPGVVASRPVQEDLDQRVLPALRERFPGLQTRFAGEAEARNESLTSLGPNYLLALVVIYALLAIPFRSYMQPIIVMSSIPFSLVGVVGGHLLHGFEISFISIMGFIAMSGVVVNDSIVLVDAINEFRNKGMNAWEAVTAAGKRRMRPILINSFTTFFGLMPIMLETSVQARFLVPMAISLAWGVMYGTVVAVCVAPAFYIAVEDASWVLRMIPWLISRRGPRPEPGWRATGALSAPEPPP